MPRAQNSRRPLLFRSGRLPSPPSPPPSLVLEWASPWLRMELTGLHPRCLGNSTLIQQRLELSSVLGSACFLSLGFRAPLDGEWKHGPFPCSSSPAHPVGNTAKAISERTVRPWEPGQLRSQENSLLISQFHAPPPAACPASLFSVLYKTLCWKSLGGSETTALANPPPHPPTLVWFVHRLEGA